MDYRTDENATGIAFLKKQLGEDGIPGYVRNTKQASGGKGDDHSHFAVPNKKEFPYRTPEETWNSYAYLKTASHGLGKHTREFAERCLKLAAAQHCIENDLCEIDMVLSNHDKQASEEQADAGEYALTVSKKNGAGESGESVGRFYPVNTPAEIRKSAATVANEPNLPVEWERMAAVNIVGAAERAGIGTDELPVKIARLGVRREPDFKVAAEVADYRARHVDDPEVGDLYRSIVKSAEHDPEGNVEKYAELMVDFDRANGLVDRYGKGVVNPYEAFFSGPLESEIDKIASENVYVDKVDAMVPTAALKNIRNHISTVFSKKAAENLKTLIDRNGDDGKTLSAAIGELPLSTQRQLIDLAVKKG